MRDRFSDIKIRDGGEEIVIFLKFADVRAGCLVAERIRKAVDKLVEEGQ